MSTEQYLQAGKEHTSKDTEISWKEVNYLQNQINNNVWWLCEILGYSKDKDLDRMKENLIDHGLEVPQMRVLIKDHKNWSFESGKNIPTRPVVNGRAGFNTHLSETLSHILEPIALEMTGVEINSTEEALAAFEKVNFNIKTDTKWRERNILNKALKKDDKRVQPSHSYVSEDRLDDSDQTHTATDINQHVIFSGTKAKGDRTDVNIDEEAVLITEILADLIRENEQASPQNVEEMDKGMKKPAKSDIRHFFLPKKEPEKKHNGKNKLNSLYADLEKDMRKRAEKKNNMTEKVRDLTSAGIFWKRRDEEIKETEREAGADTSESDTPPLQELDSDPIMIGGDVMTLYPSLDTITTSQIAAQAVRNTEVKFGGIDYDRLSVYLTLILGEHILNKYGLYHIIPRRKDDSKAVSLAAKNNKDLTGWEVGNTYFSDKDKREMVALLVQTCTIILMSSHIYTFGGRIFLQKSGAGIGLRASACLARIVMCEWDTRLALQQFFSRINCYSFH